MKPDHPEADDHTMQTQMPSPNPPSAAPGQRTLPSGIIPTDCLFQGNQEILISHHGEHYRLRITKNGKLILTK